MYFYTLLNSAPSLTKVGRAAPVRYNVIHTKIIAGTVTLSGSPVSGAVVRLFNVTDNVHHGARTTNGSGYYEFDDVDQGASPDTYHAYVEYESGGTKYHALSQPNLIPT